MLKCPDAAGKGALARKLRNLAECAFVREIGAYSDGTKASAYQIEEAKHACLFPECAKECTDEWKKAVERMEAKKARNVPTTYSLIKKSSVVATMANQASIAAAYSEDCTCGIDTILLLPIMMVIVGFVSYFIGYMVRWREHGLRDLVQVSKVDNMRQFEYTHGSHEVKENPSSKS